MDRIKCEACKAESMAEGAKLVCRSCYGILQVEVKALQSSYEILGHAFNTMRDRIHSLPDELLGPIAEACRKSNGPCFCGCHVSEVMDQSVSPRKSDHQ